MNVIWKNRLRAHKGVIFTAVTTAIIGTAATVALFAAPANVTIDFTKNIQVLADKPFSGTVSTYGQQTINTSAAQRSTVGSLGLGFYRVPLQWNGGAIVSSAGGHPGGSGDDWVKNIRAMGGEPMIVIGGSDDNNFSPAEAANMVKHFSGANKVTYWVIGNEPGNGGMSIGTYCNLFNSSVDAMKAVDPSIKVAGPAWAYFDENNIKAFLQCAGSKVDIIDFHHYAMGEKYLSNEDALKQTINWENEVKKTRELISQIVPARAAQIAVQVGEYNWSWRAEDGYPGWNGDDRFYQSVNTVWAASVAGRIAKAGGRGHQYADLNGPLGLTFEKQNEADHYGRKLTDPMPIYHGLRMFSGGNLFRGFGSTMVDATTSLSDVEVYASTNQKNAVLINKNPDQVRAASIQLNGFEHGTVEVWQTNKDKPFDAPQRKATLTVDSSFNYELPPYSVTTFILNETPKTEPTPAPNPTPPPPTPNPSPSPAPATIPLRINVGGQALTDAAGNKWTADMYASGGTTDAQAAGKAIAGTASQQIYQDERYGDFAYKIPLANGSYKVRLHFAEIYTACQTAGCRVFNATIESAAWLTKYDIAAKVGAMKAVTEEKIVTVTDGELTLVFVSQTGAAQLAGIEVLSPDTATQPTPTPTPPAPTPNPVPVQKGLLGTYFAGMNLDGASKTRVDGELQFDWGAGSPMSGIGADKFSVRWTGQITPPKSDTYTFYLTGDDGVRLWIDDKQIIGGWRDQSSREYSAKVTLEGGKAYNIRVDYYENGGAAVAKLAWSSPSITKRIVPSDVLAPRAPQGLATTFYKYDGKGNFGSEIYSTISSNIDFGWGAAAPNSFVPKDQYGVNWAGTVTAPTTGEYSFTTLSDDGVRLWVNNQKIIDAWNDHSARRDTGTIRLEAGKTYPITMTYYENYGDAVAKLLWKVPGQNEVIVPSSVLGQN